jgi:hypothetical protein
MRDTRVLLHMLRSFVVTGRGGFKSEFGEIHKIAIISPRLMLGTTIFSLMEIKRSYHRKQGRINYYELNELNELKYEK